MRMFFPCAFNHPSIIALRLTSITLLLIKDGGVGKSERYNRCRARREDCQQVRLGAAVGTETATIIALRRKKQQPMYCML